MFWQKRASLDISVQPSGNAASFLYLKPRHCETCKQCSKLPKKNFYYFFVNLFASYILQKLFDLVLIDFSNLICLFIILLFPLVAYFLLFRSVNLVALQGQTKIYCLIFCVYPETKRASIDRHRIFGSRRTGQNRVEKDKRVEKHNGNRS